MVVTVMATGDHIFPEMVVKDSRFSIQNVKEGELISAFLNASHGKHCVNVLAVKILIITGSDHQAEQEL